MKRKQDLLTIEETIELRNLIDHLNLKLREIAELIGTKYISSVSIWINSDRAPGRFRALLELLKLRKKLREVNKQLVL